MGFRYRKSFNLAPGLKMNLGKKSASVSFGEKGGHITAGTSGKITASAGLPGTGLSYTTSTGGGTKKRSELPEIILAAIVVGIITLIVWAVWPRERATQPPPVASAQPGGRPAGHLTDQPADEAPTLDEMEQAARTYLADAFQFDVASCRMNSGSLEITLSIPGLTDQTAPEQAPDNWQDIQQRTVSAQVRLPEEIGTKTPAIVLIRDAEDTLLLSVQRGKITYDEYRESPDTPAATPDAGTIYVWVTSSGNRYHTNSTCSSMTNPTMVSLEEAMRRGYTACKTCG